jgi:DNA polymerase-3 subunit alpha
MKKSNFVHLHVHSEYSILDGVPSLGEIVGKAKEEGMPYLAITDHGNIFGAVEFATLAESNGIVPIIGCEVYVAPKSRFEKTSKKEDDGNFHLVLLTMNEEGYKNLCKLITLSYTEGFFRKPRVDKELLKKFSDGLIATSSCMQGEVPLLLLKGFYSEAVRAAKEYREIFGDRFYLEVQANNLPHQRVVNEGLRRISEETGIPLVATNDVHFIDKKDVEVQDILLCIQTGTTLNDPERFKIQTDEIYFKSEQEMLRDLQGFEDAVYRTMEIAEKISFRFDFGTVHIPQIGSYSDLEKLAKEGLEEKLKIMEEKNALPFPKEEYYKRLQYELEVIKNLKFHSYFLIVADIVSYAKKKGIPVGAGRGSAAGSLVAYALGITSVDPLRFGLLFERFLNPGRTTMPDIDVDVCAKRRDEVLSYIVEKYGKANVAHIVTFSTRKAKGAVRDVGRVMGISPEMLNRIAKNVPNVEDPSSLESVDLREFAGEADIDALIHYAKKILTKVRNPSVHAGGVVISDTPLFNYVPLCRISEDKTELAVQFDKDSIEKIGLVKFDILGVESLTQIYKAIELIKKTKNIELKIEDIPFDDKKTYELISSGDTWGVFQIEKETARNLAKRMKIEKFEDIIPLVALNRPGPLQSGLVEEYVKRKRGEIPIKYPHPAVKEILEETYGVILYQEQIMRLAMKVAGFSWAEADKLRSAIAKKHGEEVMEEYLKKLVEGAVKRGIPEKIAVEIFEPVRKFGEYGFNKSHSVAYAFLTYYTAYFKANYPAEFMAARLTIKMDKIEEVAKYLLQCRRMNLKILPPDVNKSEVEFVPEGENSIRFGLGAIKNVGIATAEVIVEERKKNGEFKSIVDFIKRVDPRKVNKKVIESLIKAGAFDWTGFKRAQLFTLLPKLLEDIGRIRKLEESGQLGMFRGEGELEGIKIPEVEEWFETKFIEYEREVLGVPITFHPLSRYEREIEKLGFDRTVEVEEEEKKEFKLCGIVRDLQIKTAKKKNNSPTYATFTLEDLYGTAEIIVFQSKLELFKSKYLQGEPIVVTAKSDASGEEELRLILLDVWTLSEAIANYYKKAVIKIDAENLNEEDSRRLMSFIEKHKGNIKLFICVLLPDGREVLLEMPERFKVPYDENFKEELKEKFNADIIYYGK